MRRWGSCTKDCGVADKQTISRSIADTMSTIRELHRRMRDAGSSNWPVRTDPYSTPSATRCGPTEHGHAHWLTAGVVGHDIALCAGLRAIKTDHNISAAIERAVHTPTCAMSVVRAAWRTRIRQAVEQRVTYIPVNPSMGCLGGTTHEVIRKHPAQRTAIHATRDERSVRRCRRVLNGATSAS